MVENQLYYRTMIVSPGQSLRREGLAVASPFGPNAEMPISAVMKELHVHVEDSKTYVSLDSPIVGGPVIAICEGEEKLLIPGEQEVFDSTEVLILAKKTNYIQMIFLDGHSGDNPLFKDS